MAPEKHIISPLYKKWLQYGSRICIEIPHCPKEGRRCVANIPPHSETNFWLATQTQNCKASEIQNGQYLAMSPITCVKFYNIVRHIMS